jgi:hypothetical protein
MNRTISKSENYDSIKNIMNTIRLTGFHYLLVSAILIPISIYCNHVFLKSEIFHLTSGYPDPGFTNLEWFHLVVATYAYPIGYNYLIILILLTLSLLTLTLLKVNDIDNIYDTCL